LPYVLGDPVFYDQVMEVFFLPNPTNPEGETHVAQLDPSRSVDTRPAADTPRRRPAAPQRPTATDAVQRRTDRLTQWRKRFLGAHRLDERLRLLVAFGLTDHDIAKVVTDVTPRSIRRWRTEGPPRTRIAERWEPIDDLCAVVGYFLADGTYDEEGIVAWLRSRQEQLGNERPLDVMSDCGFGAVRGAMEHELVSAVAEEDELVPLPQHPRSRS
jgi:hypothetical protein